MQPGFFILQANAATGPGQTSPGCQRETTGRLLRAINHRMVASRFAKDDTFAAMAVADDFFAIGRDGAWLSRDEFIGKGGEAGPPVAVYYDEVRPQIDETSAVIHGVATVVGANGMTRKFRYTDAYVLTGSGWRLVACQDTELAEGVSEAVNRGAAPAHPAWAGPGPKGDDKTVLRMLNDQYVASFREANVGWYDAHLAPDYVVTFGDGSFHDRAAALADFAIPYFADTIASFPVDSVSVRLFGDMAIIHAENDYRLKDGRVGVNRYTDIWRKHGNRWQCLSAHITVHRAAAHR